jgi:hypothetical protein
MFLQERTPEEPATASRTEIPSVAPTLKKPAAAADSESDEERRAARQMRLENHLFPLSGRAQRDFGM